MPTSFYSTLREVPSTNSIKAPIRIQCRIPKSLRPWSQNPLEITRGHSGRRSWECRTATDLSAEVEEEEEEEDNAGDRGAQRLDGEAETGCQAEVDPYSLFPMKYFPKLSLGLALYFPFEDAAVEAGDDSHWVQPTSVEVAPCISHVVPNGLKLYSVLQGILGANVRWHNLDLLPNGRYVMVSNHQSAGDLLCLYQLPHRIIHLVSSSIPKAATAVQNHRLRLWHATPEVYSELAEPSQVEPVHLFPEGGITNGMGMLQFTRGFMKFAKDSPIVPVALRVSHPFEVNLHTLTSSFIANLFLFSFLPWVTLDATILDPVRKSPEEKSFAFVKRVQEIIAEELQIPITSVSIKDKRVMMKKSRR